MPDHQHLHHAAATLKTILTRRQPEYEWIVEVLPPTVPQRGDPLASDAPPPVRASDSDEDPA